MRYRNNLVKKDKNGKRYYKPTVVPNIPIKDSDIFILINTHLFMKQKT